MGNFYTNITLQGPGQDEVAEALGAMGRSAYVSPTLDGFTVVFDGECESQDNRVLKRLTAELTKRFGCAAIAVINHDDDILWYQLYKNGEPLDEYNSAPDYFEPEGEPSGPSGGDAARLVQAFGVAADAKAVEQVLRTSSLDDDGYTFECERHQALATLLGMPLFGVGGGFNYISEGELPEGLTDKNIRRVG